MYKIQLQYLFYETCILGAENLRWHAKQAACICTIENCVLHRIFSAYCKTYFLLSFLHTHLYDFASFGSLRPKSSSDRDVEKIILFFIFSPAIFLA